MRPDPRPVRMFVLFLALVAVGAFASGEARAAGVFSLTGETINGPLTSVSNSCNPDGVSSATATASGVATGPYPGTFTATVTATFGPFSISPEGLVSGGQVLSWDESFVIDTVFGQITGTKTLPTPPGNTLGFCNFPGGAVVQVLADNLAYDAQLLDQTDRGSAGAEFSYSGVLGANSNFGETFTSIPTSTPGKATGGGQLNDAALTMFTFTAYNDPKRGIHARCNVANEMVDILCQDADTYSQVGTTATFSGPALVNGAPTTYRITAADNGEPNNGSDTFSIVTGLGYSVAGLVTQGNIQVHQ
jgi:hypothetical protein